MNRHNRGATIQMPQEVMTTANAKRPKAQSAKGGDQFLTGDARTAADAVIELSGNRDPLYSDKLQFGNMLTRNL